MFEIAKMSGTSAAQIEKTYAHLLRGHADRWRTALDAYDQGWASVDTGGDRLPSNTIGNTLFAGFSTYGAWRSLVSALVWGTRGPEFKSRRPD